MQTSEGRAVQAEEIANAEVGWIPKAAKSGSKVIGLSNQKDGVVIP